MIWLLPAFVISLISCLLVTHWVRGWATRAGIIDIPDGGRHGHDGPVPRAGGISIYLTFLALITWGVVAGVPYLQAEGSDLRALVLGGSAIFALGLVDDVRGLQPRTKLLVQVAVAFGVFLAGIRIESVGLPGDSLITFPVVVSALLTVTWIVGISNAFNIIDGSDGIAAGAALFAAGSMALVFTLTGEWTGAFVAIVIAGAALGFLFFNFPPASVFLGDSGSLFLGFSLGALGVITAQKAPTFLAIAIPVVSCGLPVLDTLLAVVRRFLRREPLFTGDRGHIHHRLRDLGHSPRRVALLLYATCAAFALVSLVLVQPSGGLLATVFVTGGLIVWLLLQKLRIPELIELQRIMQRGWHQRTVIANNLRIREAAAQLRVAESGRDFLRALEYAFEAGEFEQVEIWIQEDVARPLRETREITSVAGGSLWRWRKDNTAASVAADMAAQNIASQSAWELRLPFRDESGQTVGRLDLWRNTANPHLLMDIQLIATELHPEIQRTLLRLSVQPSLRRRRAAQPAPLRPSAAGHPEPTPSRLG